MRIEGFGQVLEEAVRVFGRGPDQRVADDHAQLAVHAPVDEEAETLIAEPLQPLLLIQRAHFGIIRGSGAVRNEEVAGQEEGSQQTHGAHKKSGFRTWEAYPFKRKLKIFG